MKAQVGKWFGLAAVCALGACDGRPSYWDQGVPTELQSFGLANGVVVIDEPDHRAVILTVGTGLDVRRTTMPIGHNFLNAAPSADGKTLYVLSAGDWPRQTKDDEFPSLTRITIDSSGQTSSHKFQMSEPLSSLAVDKSGQYVVAYYGDTTAKSAAVPFTQNPNELVIFDVSQGGEALPNNPVDYTLRSYGGAPQRFTFTDPMSLPAGAPTGAPRRLLLVETTLDLSILDMSHVFDMNPRHEITVPLSNGTSVQQLSPAGLSVDPNDGFIALRTTTDTNVYLLQLIAAKPGLENDFNPSIDLIEVGGVPSDLAFVQTDIGLELAALVPSKSDGVLIELGNNNFVTTPVAFSAAYSSLSIVTQAVSASAGMQATTDTALLWDSTGGSSGVALWSLGTSGRTPYRSVQVLSVANAVRAVDDVPFPNDRLKVLETTATTNGGSFFVLDLAQQTAAPLLTTSNPTISIAPDGGRVWAFAQGGTELAAIPLDAADSLNPIPLTTIRPIRAVYDVHAGSTDSNSRALIALHDADTYGLTVFDALAPDAAEARMYPALLLEGP